MPRSVPKLVGADFELGNFVLGAGRPGGTGAEASRALLREVAGVASSRRGQLVLGGAVGWGSACDARDWGRVFLRENGGCVYIDLDHLELCIPEVRSAWDHVAAWHAMLRIARGALERANARLPDGRRIQVLVNNSDGRSHSYGSHLNFLMDREAWENLVWRKPHHLLFLATLQVTSLPLTGQGKVGAENGRPPVHYQLSQRADFFETLVGPQTTYARPLVNARDEDLCGSRRDLARLHSIFFDAGLCHVAGVLKVGLVQIALALLEEQILDPGLLLDDPVTAVLAVSRDLQLGEALPLVSGKRATALELQGRFLELARRHRDAGGLEAVARVDELLDLWQRTLTALERGDLDALAGRLDWVLKLRALEGALAARGDLDWDAPELRYLDQLYASLDPDEGLYWAYEAAGVAERLVPERAVERLAHDPPEDTRAWTRARVLRHFTPDEIAEVDWDRIALDVERDGRMRRLVLPLDDPLGFGRDHDAEAAALREQGGER